jgi:hypothetical protein
MTAVLDADSRLSAEMLTLAQCAQMIANDELSCIGIA